MRNALVLASTVLVAWVVDRGARADTTEPVHLLYRAPGAGCPTRGEFIARVRARTTRVRPAWEDEKARTFDVAIEGASPFSGHLTLRDAEGHDSVRSVEGETCSKVADALALVVALAVDPQAAETPAPPVDPPAPPPVVDLAPPVAATVALPEPSPLPPAEQAQPRQAPLRSWSISAGAELVVAGAVAPDLLPGVAPFLEASPWRRAPIAPSFRLALSGRRAHRSPSTARARRSRGRSGA